MTVSIDLRPVLSPIRDQGNRGTCLAFAVTSLHEVHRAGRAPVDEDLAVEALYWGCKQIDGDWSTGTSFQSASAALLRWGQPIETVWPYDPNRLDGTPYQAPITPSNVDWFQAELRSEAATSANVRTLLASNLPVALGITLYPSFYRPSNSGHIADPLPGEPKKGRHAVVAVGYDAGRILVRNSWGNYWGLSGYGWISNSYVDSHATDVWTLVVSAGTLTPPTPQLHDLAINTYGTE
jgi:C1A family cysteine protease